MSAPPESQCDAKALDWAIFSLSLVSTHLTWWILPLPTIWRKGFKVYVHDVAWECLRHHIPSYVAHVASKQKRQHWHMCYYSGVIRDPTAFSYAKSFISDSLIITTTCLAIYRLCRGGDKDISGLNSSLWMYPSLPVALIGLWTSVSSRTQIRLNIIISTGLIVLALIAIAIALTINFLYGHGIWVPTTIIFIFMAFPIYAFSRRLIMFGVFWAGFGRFGGQVAGALNNTAYFPFCALKGYRFAGPVIVFGVLACLLALYGLTLQPRKEEEESKEMGEVLSPEA